MKKYLFYSILSLAVVGLVGASLVSANWQGEKGDCPLPPNDRPEISEDMRAEMQAKMLEQRAEILGINTEELRALIDEGKTPQEIAESLGFTKEEMREKTEAQRVEHMKERMQTLVDKGKITQDEADQKLAEMQERFENGESFGKMPHKGKFGKKFDQKTE